MLSVDPYGWLKTDAPGDPEWRMVPSKRHSPLAAKPPLAPIWHTTDSPTPGARVADHWREMPFGEQPFASAHVVVGRDGVVFQCVPFLLGAWHAKRPSSFKGALVDEGAYRTTIAGVEVPSINAYTSGYEVENLGQLKRHQIDDRVVFTRWPHYLDPKHPTSGPDPVLQVDPARAVEHAGQWYDDFTPAQVVACGALLKAEAAAYGWKREHCALGHVDIDPDRKQDPWPVFRTVYLPKILDATFPALIA